MTDVKSCHGCGAEIEASTRYHWTDDGSGHYADPDPRAPLPALDPTQDRRAIPAHLQRASVLWGESPARAPAPGPVPRKPWDLEEELRGRATDLFERVGYHVHDLEQGYRPDGSTRVALGIADQYVQHPELRVRAWVEYKRWDNEPTADQHAFAAAELAAGGVYLLIYELGQIAAWHAAVRRGATL